MDFADSRKFAVCGWGMDSRNVGIKQVTHHQLMLIGGSLGSVSDQYSLNPDLAKNLNTGPDPEDP